MSSLGAVVTVLGLIACIVPGIYLAVAFTVAVPVLLTEGLRGRDGAGALAAADQRGAGGEPWR